MKSSSDDEAEDIFNKSNDKQVTVIQTNSRDNLDFTVQNSNKYNGHAKKIWPHRSF